MSIPAIGAVGFTPSSSPRCPLPPARPPRAVGPLGASTAPADACPSAASGSDFPTLLSQGLENLQGLHTQADDAGRPGGHR